MKTILISILSPDFSLERSDSWFKYMKTSQSLRWLFLELLFPVVITLYACFCLISKILF